jgi:predicted O-methyltransferase YrrM
MKRLEFLKKTGGGLGLVAAVPGLHPTVVDVAEGGPAAAKRDPEQLRRLLNEMDAKGYQYRSVPRKDGELLHLLVKATRARNLLEVGTSHGYSAI